LTDRHLHPPHLQKATVVLESTTYPGTTEELVLRSWKERLRCPITTGIESENIPSDFFLAFRQNAKIPATAVRLAQIPKVVGGANPGQQPCAQALYAQVVARSSGKLDQEQRMASLFFVRKHCAGQRTKLLPRAWHIDIWESSMPPLPNLRLHAVYPVAGLASLHSAIYYLSWKAREFDFALALSLEK